jgi:hypothetical protein
MPAYVCLHVVVKLGVTTVPLLTETDTLRYVAVFPVSPIVNVHLS